MASTIRQRLRRFNGTDYDTIHLETETKAIVDYVYPCNPNLLDNWYFVGGGSQQGGEHFPINQRGGYVVKPGSMYFVPGDSNPLGPTTTYYTVRRWAGNIGTSNAIFDIDDTEYITDAANCAPGYTGPGYGIDRLKILYEGSTMRLAADGLYINVFDAGQFLPTSQIVRNREYTFSLLTTDNKFGWITFKFTDTSRVINQTIGNTGINSNFIYDWGVGFTPFFLQTLGQEIGIVAVKLELGDKQTLAHQDANSNWVLNKIPNYQEQLARCQRYQLVSHGGNSGTCRGIAYTYDTTVLSIFMPLPVTLSTVKAPTVSILSGTMNCWVEGNEFSCTTGAVYGLYNDGITFGAILSEQAPIKTEAILFGEYSLLIDANL